MTPPSGASELTILYDGECPLCAREIRTLRRLDRRGRLAFEDIAAPGFDAGRYGLTGEAVMARIHAVTPDGAVVEGMEVFRRAWAAVGLGWLLAPSRWPVLGRLFDLAYAVFARHRLRPTGRSGAACGGASCALPRSAPGGEVRP